MQKSNVKATYLVQIILWVELFKLHNNVFHSLWIIPIQNENKLSRPFM